jgi:ribosomal protein S18 acetylase RimI-like enzyme
MKRDPGHAAAQGEGELSANPVSIRLLTAKEARERNASLCDVLIDCVEGGASVGFMAPLPRPKAEAFWRAIEQGVADGTRMLLIAEDGASQSVAGTVQVVLGQPENQPHRADISKMLVHRRARRQGIGALLMRAAEDSARAAGKSLLVLDTVSGGDAEWLYRRLGWEKVGEIPGYALWPDGRLCATTYYYKPLRQARGSAP